MGLLSTEVEVRLAGNIKYYENLGYDIPRRLNKHGVMTVPKNTTIMVQVKDLPPHSIFLVDVECDYCGEILCIPYSLYTQCNHDGKYYCTHCSKSVFISGKNSPNWNPNKTDEERKNHRNYNPEYVKFIKRVLTRDNYTCQCCGCTSNNMDVHHLNGYNWFIKGRTDEKNSVCLCKNCHGNFHSLYGKGYNTKEQYEEWIGYAIGELEKYDGILPTARKVFDYERNKIYNSAIEYADIYNVNATSVREVCNHKVICRKVKLKNGNETVHNTSNNTIKGHHLFWLDEYKQMSKDKILNIVNKENGCFRKVICLTTNKIFNKIIDASIEYNISDTCIVGNCNGKYKSAGKLPNGTTLHWMYYDDYLTKIKNNEPIIIEERINTRKKVICLTTTKIFESIQDASNEYGIKSPSQIAQVCIGKRNYAGKLPDETPLVWMYYDEYLEKIKNDEEIVIQKSQRIRCRKVVCLTTGEIFNQIKLAEEKYKTSSKMITRVARGDSSYAGKLADGTKLLWMYHNEFVKLPQEEQDEILSRNKEASNDVSF